MQQSHHLRAFVVGATGAVGRELVKELLRSPYWMEVVIVVRRILSEWEELPEEQQRKLKIKQVVSLESLHDVSQWDLKGLSSFFCCLGSRKRYGEKEYIRAASLYPLYCAQLALHFNVPHFSVISIELADPKSLGLIFKIKGEMEEVIKRVELSHISIFRPGLLVDRHNYKRRKEKIFGCLLFIPKNKTKNLAKALRIEAELQSKNPQTLRNIIYHYYDINYIAENEKYPFK